MTTSRLTRVGIAAVSGLLSWLAWHRGGFTGWAIAAGLALCLVLVEHLESEARRATLRRLMDHMEQENVRLRLELETARFRADVARQQAIAESHCATRGHLLVRSASEITPFCLRCGVAVNN